uniref:Uncharacterized protein n=1 Tax=Romanomermis culicivorax TaxID=13658 RepID=A0A915KMC4_ROMCU
MQFVCSGLDQADPLQTNGPEVLDHASNLIGEFGVGQFVRAIEQRGICINLCKCQLFGKFPTFLNSLNTT